MYGLRTIRYVMGVRVNVIAKDLGLARDTVYRIEREDQLYKKFYILALLYLIDHKYLHESYDKKNLLTAKRYLLMDLQESIDKESHDKHGV